QRQPDALERLLVDDVLDERDEHAGHEDQQGQRAPVAPELGEDAPRGGEGQRGAHEEAPWSTRMRKACSMSSAPVRSRRPSGVSPATIDPSRMSSSRSQRSASSMTWLETSRVVPASANERNSSQSSWRSTGSSPTVGSSSTSSSGSPSSAAARDTRV